MTLLSQANEAITATRRTIPAAGARRGLVPIYLQLAKARLSALVLFTTAVGFLMASGGGIDWMRLAWTMAGTALAAASANALNQLAESRRDGLMRRTRGRPLPSGAIGPVHTLIFAAVTAYAGCAALALGANLAAAGLALATIAIYMLVYTPLKTRTTLNTLAGAVCGAIPPMIGWVAATGRLDPGAWVLGGLLFVWQIPHFMALAWLYRDDYRRGGYAMLPVLDRTGRLTGQVVVLTALTLVPVALAATLAGLTGWLYAAGSIALGAWILGVGARLYAQRTDANARRLFLASIVYLPAVLCLMVIDRAPPGGGGALIGPVAAARPLAAVPALEAE